jgi:hypothetical protein
MYKKTMYALCVVLCVDIHCESVRLISVRNVSSNSIFVGYNNRHGKRDGIVLCPRGERVLSIDLNGVNTLTMYGDASLHTSFQVFCDKDYLIVTENFIRNVIVEPLCTLSCKALSVEFGEKQASDGAIVPGIRLIREL